MMARERGAETPAHQPHEPLVHALFASAHAARLQRKIKRAPHPGDPKLLGNAGDGFEYGRKQVRVLMGIQMRRAQAGVDNAPDLLDQFLVDTNSAERHGAHQLRDGERKSGRSDQHQMAADIERGCFLGQTYGVVEGIASHHR